VEALGGIGQALVILCKAAKAAIQAKLRSTTQRLGGTKFFSGSTRKSSSKQGHQSKITPFRG